MSQDVLKESLSALLDNEADDLELRRVLNASDESEVRNTWSRYQIARAAMHNELHTAQIDLSAGIMAAINAEPAPLVDQQETLDQPKKAANSPWIMRVAVAASVTLAVLGGVRFYNQDIIQQDVLVAQSEQRLPANTQAQGPAILASYGAQGEDAPMVQAVSGQSSWYEQRLPNYLRQHAQQTSINKTESGLPYARAASLEGQ